MFQCTRSGAAPCRWQGGQAASSPAAHAREAPARSVAGASLGLSSERTLLTPRGAVPGNPSSLSERRPVSLTPARRLGVAVSRFPGFPEGRWGRRRHGRATAGVGGRTAGATKGSGGSRKSGPGRAGRTFSKKYETLTRKAGEKTSFSPHVRGVVRPLCPTILGQRGSSLRVSLASPLSSHRLCNLHKVQQCDHFRGREDQLGGGVGGGDPLLLLWPLGPLAKPPGPLVGDSEGRRKAEKHQSKCLWENTVQHL